MPTLLKTTNNNVTTIRFNDDYTRTVIDIAARLSHQTRTAFLLSVARKEAENLIKERQGTLKEITSLILSKKASKIVVQALLNPPKPNKALRLLAKTYKKSNVKDRT